MLPLVLSICPDNTRGIVRMAAKDMDRRGLSAGATVRIEAQRTGYARVAPGAVPLGTIEADRMTAANCGLPEGGKALVQPESLGPLDHVLLRVETKVAATPADLQDALFDMAVSQGDRLCVTLPNARTMNILVLEASPKGHGLVSDGTRVALETPAASIPGFDKVGGMARQVAEVHEMIAAPLRRPDLFARLGIPAPRGVLFSGPPGSGKTLLARSVAREANASFFQIDGPEILSKHYGESEAALRRVFEAASKAQPAIIFIDEIDSLAPRRESLSGEKQVEKRIVAQLLTLMDGLADRGRVVVMAATNLPDSIDPALRRPGRFDREIVFQPPNADERREILEVHLADAPLEPEVDLARIAGEARGYVGADLAALASEAAMAALARAIRSADGEAGVRAETLMVSQDDLELGLLKTSPSLLRASGAPVLSARWDDIGGLDPVKQALREAVEWPERHAGAVKSLGLAAPRGILLTGPPGSGKTMLARALSGEVNRNFVSVRPPDLVSQFLGEAEKAVSLLFERARNTAPCVLFFDEFDAIAPRRGRTEPVFERIVAQLLVEIDGIGAGRGITVLAATNRASAIDPALLRPGRMDRTIDIPLPDNKARAAILAVHVATRACTQGMDLARFADATEGYSGADLAGLVERAGWIALSRSVATNAPPEIAEVDLEQALAEHAMRKGVERSDHITATETPA